MVKGEAENAAVVPTESALTPGLLDQGAPHPLMPSRHRFTDAAPATPAAAALAVGVPRELREAVATAFLFPDRLKPVHRGRAPCADHDWAMLE